MRDRLALPVLLPILGFVAIGLTIFSFGYVLLQVSETRQAWPVAIVVASAILLIAAYLNYQPSVRGLPFYALTALPTSVILAIGLYFFIRPAPPTLEGPAVAAVIQPPGPINEIARDNFFEVNEYTIIAGQQYTLNLANQGQALHNWRALNVTGADGQPITTTLLPGGQSETINFTITQPGDYTFHCDVHPVEMVGTLRVISQEEAAAAAAAAPAGAAGGGSPGPGQITAIATDNRFSPTEFIANANEQTSLTLDNRGQQIHNWHVQNVTGTDGRPIQTTLLPGGRSETIQFTIAQPGAYQVICDVHPVEMRGTLTVR